uniref:Uncharacterized protein n=1 Tax=Lutzomyia longipalpis TaxID=7200 RepID=A0A1B0CGR4_LUTLO
MMLRLSEYFPSASIFSTLTQDSLPTCRLPTQQRRSGAERVEPNDTNYDGNSSMALFALLQARHSSDASTPQLQTTHVQEAN